MNRLKECRVKAGLSQKFVALSLEIAGPSVSNWESGKKNPSHENLIKLARLYGVSIDYLVGESDDATVSKNETLPKNYKKPDTLEGIELSEEEARLISLYRQLSDRNKVRAAAYLEGAAGSQEQPDAPRHQEF